MIIDNIRIPLRREAGEHGCGAYRAHRLANDQLARGPSPSAFSGIWRWPVSWPSRRAGQRLEPARGADHGGPAPAAFSIGALTASTGEQPPPAELPDRSPSIAPASAWSVALAVRTLRGRDSGQMVGRAPRRWAFRDHPGGRRLERMEPGWRCVLGRWRTRTSAPDARPPLNRLHAGPELDVGGIANVRRTAKRSFHDSRSG